MRVRIHATPEIQLVISEVQEWANLRHKSGVIRASINAAHTACMHTASERFVIRNESLHEQRDFYVGPGVMMAMPPKSYPAVETKLDSITELQMQELLGQRFGVNKQEVVIRALRLYREILKERTAGWQLGYLSDDNQFLLVELASAMV